MSGASNTTRDRWVIELILDNKADADMAYEAIENLLVNMGEVGNTIASASDPQLACGDGEMSTSLRKSTISQARNGDRRSLNANTTIGQGSLRPEGQGIPTRLCAIIATVGTSRPKMSYVRWSLQMPDTSKTTERLAILLSEGLDLCVRASKLDKQYERAIEAGNGKDIPRRSALRHASPVGAENCTKPIWRLGKSEPSRHC